MPMSALAKSQFALFSQPTQSAENPPASAPRQSPSTARAKGKTRRFASADIGETKWKYQAISGNDPSQAASETLATPMPQRRAPSRPTRQRGSRTRGKNGSGAPIPRSLRSIGEASRRMTSTTANES